MLIELIKAGFKNGFAWIACGALSAGASIKFVIDVIQESVK